MNKHSAENLGNPSKPRLISLASSQSIALWPLFAYKGPDHPQVAIIDKAERNVSGRINYCKKLMMTADMS